MTVTTAQHKQVKQRNSATYTRREMMVQGGLAAMSALGAAQLGCQQSRPSIEQPNIIVFLADALRADHLGYHGHGTPTSPRLDALAATSIVFDRCYAQSCWTKPTIASLFTGYVPQVHQAVLTTWDLDNPEAKPVQILRETFDTLALSLAARGYQTALFQSNPHCQDQFGFARGFEHYRYVPGEPPALQVDAVLQWLREQAAAPFFAFIHEIDPHGPYIPEPRFHRELFDCTPEEARENLSREDLEIIKGFEHRYLPDIPRFYLPRLRELSAHGLAYLVGLYDAEIRGVDYHVGRMLDYLDQQRMSDHTIFVFISDHGQAFGEHGQFAHNNSLYEEEIHVPLLIHMGNRQEGMRIPWNVNLYDLLPTLITLAGGEADARIQARTLLEKDGTPLVQANRPICAYHDRNHIDDASWHFCHITDDYKVIDKGATLTPEIYHRRDDPGETRNLFESIPHAAHLLDAARAVREEHRVLAARFGPPAYVRGDEDTQEELRALGYL